jgi:hypothetical protein
MPAYRAAYWISDDEQAEIVLTAAEEAHLSDADLLEHAHVEAARGDVDLSTGEIRIGTWRESATDE